MLGKPTDISPAIEAAKAGRKLDKVEAVARALFLEHGFHATSMDAIAREAAVSKATLYSYFPSKEALFAHLIDAECKAMVQQIRLPDMSSGIEAALRSFSYEYVKMFLDAEKFAFFRVVSAESSRFPIICRAFFENGPGSNIRRIAQFLEEAKARGLLEFADANLAAIQLASLIRGELPVYTALGIEKPDDATISRIIESGIKVFLRSYAR